MVYDAGVWDQDKGTIKQLIAKNAKKDNGVFITTGLVW